MPTNLTIKLSEYVDVLYLILSLFRSKIFYQGIVETIIWELSLFLVLTYISNVPHSNGILCFVQYLT